VKKSIWTIRIIGIGFLLIFCFYFFLGSFVDPLLFEIKKANTTSYFSQELPKEPRPSLNPLETELQELSSIPVSQDSTKAMKLDSIKSKTVNSINPIFTGQGIERVLLIGDSQLEGLRYPVSSYCEKNNHVLLSTVIWYGSSTKQWAITDTLEYFLTNYKPTVVLFAIGLNELFVRDFSARSKYIQSILKTFSDYGVRYYWIGPAAWTKDKGIIDVMAKEVGTYFFPSHNIKMERAKDGRHPTKKAAKLWFDQVAEEITKQGIIDFSVKADNVSKLKFKRTVLLTLKK
jgi:hypothetical protein